MASALGACVHPGAANEVGWAPIELSEAGKTSFLAMLEGVPVLH